MQTLTAFDKVHDCWIAIIHEAIDNFSHFAAVPYLAPILSGETAIVWNNLDRQCDNRTVSYIIPALVAQANRYDRQGLDISAHECRWLVGKFRTGEMTAIGSYLLK